MKGEPHILTLCADLNEVNDKTIWTSLRRTEFAPEGDLWEGQRVVLRDHEGNVCHGIVTEVNYPIVYVELDLRTWVDGDAVRVEEEYGDSSRREKALNIRREPSGEKRSAQ